MPPQAEQHSSSEIVFDSAAYEQAMHRLLDDGPQEAVVLFIGTATEDKQQALGQLIEASGSSLHQIDLSSRLGERTEETRGNVRELFDVGSEGAAVLFLNNVDLFFEQAPGGEPEEGELTPVDYLIQRIEAYKGLVILSLEDPAHVQRLREALEIDLVVRF